MKYSEYSKQKYTSKQNLLRTMPIKEMVELIEDMDSIIYSSENGIP